MSFSTSMNSTTGTYEDPPMFMNSVATSFHVSGGSNSRAEDEEAVGILDMGFGRSSGRNSAALGPPVLLTTDSKASFGQSKSSFGQSLRSAGGKSSHGSLAGHPFPLPRQASHDDVLALQPDGSTPMFSPKRAARAAKESPPTVPDSATPVKREVTEDLGSSESPASDGVARASPGCDSPSSAVSHVSLSGPPLQKRNTDPPLPASPPRAEPTALVPRPPIRDVTVPSGSGVATEQDPRRLQQLATARRAKDALRVRSRLHKLFTDLLLLDEQFDAMMAVHRETQPTRPIPIMGRTSHYKSSFSGSLAGAIAPPTPRLTVSPRRALPPKSAGRGTPRQRVPVPPTSKQRRVR